MLSDSSPCPWRAHLSQGASWSMHKVGDPVSSSVTSGISSSGSCTVKSSEGGLVFGGRGDSVVKRYLSVVGEGGAFGSRGWERIAGVAVGIMASRETYANWSLRVVLCTGEGIVESAVPLAAQDQNEWFRPQRHH
jgi:hypothetical protein